jgi:hypothetical protein
MVISCHNNKHLTQIVLDFMNDVLYGWSFSCFDEEGKNKAMKVTGPRFKL